MENKFDNMNINIPYLYKEEHCVKKFHPPGILKRIFNRYFTALLFKTGIYKRLINSGIILGWFDEFREYWLTILKGRPLSFHDFHYLLGVYRQKFQNVEVAENLSPSIFLKSWQNASNLALLFGSVKKYSYAPLYNYGFEKWLKNGDKILEYGCGIAPISYGLLKYGVKSNLDITIADIPQINGHYARWRLGNKVKFIEIEPYKDCLEQKKFFDVVFMTTVMEHLPDPLNVIKNITKHLNPGGTFVFDYILSEGEGLDTKEAVNERDQVIDYIESKYNFISGKISKGKSTTSVIVCKLK